MENELTTALLEVGTEELPPRFFYEALDQLKTLAEKELGGSRLTYEKMDVYGTPRRLVLEIGGLPEKQPDLEKEVRGPAKASAYDTDGQPTQALLGFLKGHNLPIEAASFKDFSGKPYVVAQVHQKGKPTIEVLSELFPFWIKKLTFPKSMRWDGDLTFGRPIRWLLALYGKAVVPFRLEQLESGAASHGHRFLSKGEVRVDRPSEYQKTLEKAFVISHHPTRRELIRHQVEELASSKSARVYRLDALLDEVTLLVEYPTAFLGSFEERFLSLPQEVLITVMQHHQRYFPLVTSEGRLLRHFVGVRNGDKEGLSDVTFGNEQVIRARFKDAEYFFETDKKTKLEARFNQLDKLVFQKNLGTIKQKVERIQQLAQRLRTECKLEKEVSADELDLVVRLCKCDLATQMVFEFPELQGVMGKEYALRDGHRSEIAEAILDHYLPRFQGDALPKTLMGALIGVADRIDTLAGCFALKLKPSGSSDPLGLRRASTALLQILMKNCFDLNLKHLMRESLSNIGKQFPELGAAPKGSSQTSDSLNPLKKHDPAPTWIRLVLSELEPFVIERAETLWKANSIRYDIIRTALPLILERPHTAFVRAQFLESLRTENKETFKVFVIAWTRVFNILKSKEGQQIAEQLSSPPAIHLDKLPEPEEKALGKLLEASEPDIRKDLENEDIDKAYKKLFAFEKPIHAFFDKVLVMSENEELKNERINLLFRLQRLFLDSFGDITQTVLD